MLLFLFLFLQLPDHYFRNVGAINTAPISNRRKSESKIDYSNHEQLKNGDKKDCNNTSKIDKIVVPISDINNATKVSNKVCNMNTNSINSNTSIDANNDNDGVNEIEDDAIAHDEVHSDCEIDDEVDVVKNNIENENHKKRYAHNIKR